MTHPTLGWSLDSVPQLLSPDSVIVFRPLDSITRFFRPVGGILGCFEILKIKLPGVENQK